MLVIEYMALIITTAEVWFFLRVFFRGHRQRFAGFIVALMKNGVILNKCFIPRKKVRDDTIYSAYNE